jgi:hypothetical protein
MTVRQVLRVLLRQKTIAHLIVGKGWKTQASGNKRG